MVKRDPSKPPAEMAYCPLLGAAIVNDESVRGGRVTFCRKMEAGGRCSLSGRGCDSATVYSPIRRGTWRRMGTYQHMDDGKTGARVFVTGFQCVDCGHKFFTPEFDPDGLDEKTPDYCYCGRRMEKHRPERKRGADGG